MNNRYVAIQAPRESAKSTIAAFLYVTHQIVFKNKRFIVIVQNTYSKSKETLNNIKDEIKNNPMLQEDFGIEVKRDQEGDSILVHPDGHAIRILCKGADQIGGVRGEKFGAYRPDLILIDDLEDDDMVRNPERRIVLQALYDEALVPAGDREICQHIAIGTILHDDSLMAKLVSKEEYPEYAKLFFRARFENSLTKQLESLWESKWTLEQLNELERTKPEVFAKEYQGDPVIGSMQKFMKEDFRRWALEDGHYVLYNSEGKVVTRGLLSNCRAAIGNDLAWEEKKSADFTVVMPVFLTPDSDLLIDTYFCDRGVRPDQYEEILFAMEARLRALTGKSVPIGFEKAKLEKVMKWFLKGAMRRRNHWLSLKDISWVNDKIARIVTALQPRYKMHTVYHLKGMGDLENQLLRIPSGKHDDLPDAEQIAVRCLNYEPKIKKAKTVIEDPHFDWLYKQLRKKTPVKRFAFGRRTQSIRELPAKEAWR